MSRLSKRFLFRVDAGKIIGIGHRSRCAVLANELRDLGADVTFLSRRHEGTIETAPAEIHWLPLCIGGADKQSYGSWLGASPVQEWQDLQAELARQKYDALILDHYGYEKDLLTQALSRIPTLVIDDTGERNLSGAVWVLNHNFSADPRAYSSTSSPTQLLLGPRYALISRAIRAARRQAAPRDGKNRRILVHFGSAPAAEIHRFLRWIHETAALQDREIQAILPATWSVEDRDKAKCLFEGWDTAVSLHFGTDRMAELLLWADFAIGAGGVSALERSVAGLPSVVMGFAENQRPLLDGISRVKIAMSLGMAGEVTRERWDEFFCTDFALTGLWQNYSENALREVDGEGASRVATRMLDATTPPF